MASAHRRRGGSEIAAGKEGPRPPMESGCSHEMPGWLVFLPPFHGDAYSANAGREGGRGGRAVCAHGSLWEHFVVARVRTRFRESVELERRFAKSFLELWRDGRWRELDELLRGGTQGMSPRHSRV